MDLQGIFSQLIERVSLTSNPDTSARGRRVAQGALATAFAFCLLAPIAFTLFPGKNNADTNGVGMPFAENVRSDLPAVIGMADVANERAFSTPKPLGYQPYTVQKGEMIGEIAQRFGLTQDTLLSVNGIKNARLIQIGRTLNIPNQDGILHVFRKNETLGSLAEKYEIEEDGIRIANGIVEDEPKIGEGVFLPAARLARIDLQEINGDLFRWPVRGGAISSRYGWRTSPFTGAKQFHSGLDIACPHGTPIKAAMSGRVRATGFDVNSGNYVVISHHSGYSTFYGHMDVIRVKSGEYVTEGQRIGDVGSTGLSTGSHVHFTVFKYGVTVNPIALIN
ncbi:MAG: peptidoglycan DD-metalloendopeptidase family protein [Treponemataceae bacterium]